MFNLPPDDLQVGLMEAQQSGRAEYARSLWVPDGLERDRARFARGVAVIRSNPGWFVGVMVHRMTFMLRYNDFGPQISGINTTIAPTVLPGPNFSHSVEAPGEMTPIWSNSPNDLIIDGITISSQARTSIAENQLLQVTSDSHRQEDLFASRPISVQNNTDYVMMVAVIPGESQSSFKVKGVDPRITLAQVAIPKASRKRKTKKVAPGIDRIPEQAMAMIRIPFATGDKNEVRLVLSRNEGGPATVVIEAGSAALFEMGTTPHLWMRAPRALVRGLQKNLFKTRHMLSLVVAGIALLALARRKQALVALLSVPAYYLFVQSIFHTEYRYILAMHYFLFVIAAVTMYLAGAALWQSALQIKARYLRRD